MKNTTYFETFVYKSATVEINELHYFIRNIPYYGRMWMLRNLIRLILFDGLNTPNHANNVYHTNE